MPIYITAHAGALNVPHQNLETPHNSYSGIARLADDIPFCGNVPLPHSHGVGGDEGPWCGTPVPGHHVGGGAYPDDGPRCGTPVHPGHPPVPNGLEAFLDRLSLGQPALAPAQEDALGLRIR